MKDRASKIPEPMDLESRLRELILSSLDGDKNAYSEFLERTAVVLRAYLMKSANSKTFRKEQVEDLVQDVLISIHQKRSTYRPDLPVLPWLFAIAKYRLIDAYRSENRKLKTTSFEDGLQSGEISEPIFTADESSLTDIENLLNQLPEKQRQVLHLAKVEEVPLNEISQRLNMSLSSVKVTIHRAIASLRKSQVEKKEMEHEDT